MDRRIIFITPSVVRDCAPGMRANFFIQSIIDKGFEPIVFSNSNSQLFSREVILYESTYIRNYNNNKLSSSIRLINEIIFGIQTAFIILISHRNVPIIYSLPPFFSLFVLKFFLPKKTKIILDIRDLYPEALNESGILDQRSRLYKLISSFFGSIIKDGIFITSATEGISKYIITNYGVISKTIFNGFPDNVKHISKEKYPDFTVVFHGILGRFQNIELLVNVINSLVDEKINFVIIGDGKKRNLLNQIVNKRFKYLGFLSNKETINIVAKCHLGISLRNNDILSINSIPVKVFEFIGLNMKSLITPKSEGSELIEKLNLGKGFENNLEDVCNFIKQSKLDFTYSKNDSFENIDTEFYSRKIQSSIFADLIHEKLNTK